MLPIIIIKVKGDKNVVVIDEVEEDIYREAMKSYIQKRERL